MATRPGDGARKSKRKKFFTRQTEASRVKAEIIAKYFPGWATVVGSRATKLNYFDLFAGRGRYDDGNESTPLLVLRRAVADPVVRRMLVTIFNDKKHATELQEAINGLPDVELLTHKPVVLAEEITGATAKVFEKKQLAPTLALIDPWGYKGLSRELIHSLLKDWGCDLIFFFNYNRINMGLTNKKVRRHMEALFGAAWVAELLEQLPGLRPVQRERAILRALRSALRQLGGEYVRPFRFLKPNGRTSHHLIFVSKSFKGVEIMRDVMAGMSSRHDDGVASFAYDPRTPESGGQLELPRPSPLDRLQKILLRDLAGKTMTVREVFERHSGDRRFTLKNYQEVLRRLEGPVKVVRPSKRATHNGRPTMPEKAIVTFPPRSVGALAASRSTPGRPALGLPTSASARPTA